MVTKAQQQLGRLRRFIASVRQGDPKLAEEGADLRVRTEALEAVPSLEVLDHALELESIVMRRERPVLVIKNNMTQLAFLDQADSEIWGERLKKASPLLDHAIRRSVASI
jgi:endonuclease G